MENTTTVIPPSGSRIYGSMIQESIEIFVCVPRDAGKYFCMLIGGNYETLDGNYDNGMSVPADMDMC